MRAIRLLNLRHLRTQPLRTALAALAIAAGVSLAVAALVDQASFSRALSDFGKGTSGPAPIRVIGAANHGGVDQATVDRVSAVPGVAVAAPIIQTVTYAVDSNGHQTLVPVLGVDCRAVTLVARIECSPDAMARARDTDPPVMSRSLAKTLGSKGAIRTDTNRVATAGGLVLPQLDTFNSGRIAIFPLVQAQRLFARPGSFDAVYVVPKPGVVMPDVRRAVASAAGEWNIVEAGNAPPRVAKQPGPTFQLLFVIGLFALAIGAQLVANAARLSLEERRTQLAVASALGGSPALVIGGVIAEAAMLGLLGGLIGVAGGVIAAGPLVAGVSSFIEKFSGIHVTVSVPWTVALAGVLIGVLVSVLASVVPARRAARMDVAGELHGHARRSEASPSTGARNGGLWLAGGAVGVLVTWFGQRDGALAAWQPPLAEIGLVIATVCCFRAVGRLTPVFIGLFRRVPRFQHGPAKVAIANLLGEPKRTSVMATAVGVAVGLACVLGSLLPAISAGSKMFTRRAAAGRLWVSSVPSNNGALIDAKTSPADLATLSHLPGVVKVDSLSFVSVNTRSVGLVAVNGVDGPTSKFAVYKGTSGDDALARGDVMVGPGLARAQHLGPGSVLRLPGRDGMVDLRVGGVWGDPNGLGKGVTMTRSAMDRIWGPQPADELWIDAAPGVSAAVMAARVRTAGLDASVRALVPDALADDIAADVKTFITPFWALQRALLLVAIIATMSTMLLVGLQRRREQGLLAALGMGPSELAQMTLVEAGLVGLAGSVLGAVASIGGYLALAFVSPILTGLQPPYRFDLVAPLGYGALATICVIAGAAWPAWQTSRLEVISALSYE